MGTTDRLRRHPLFATLAEDALAGVAAVSHELDVPAGEVLIGEGDQGDAAYLVVSGRFVVTTSSTPVGTAGRGDLVGELALLSNQPRAATVRATRDAVVLRIDGAAFCTLAASEPEVQRTLNGQLVERMRSMLSSLTHRGRGTLLAVVTDAARQHRSLSALAAALARLKVRVARDGRGPSRRGRPRDHRGCQRRGPARAGGAPIGTRSPSHCGMPTASCSCATAGLRRVGVTSCACRRRRRRSISCSCTRTRPSAHGARTAGSPSWSPTRTTTCESDLARTTIGSRAA
jgi:CRP-like cAMP-binding protein